MASFDSLAPWDANTYFQAPKETRFSTSTQGVQLADANPNRVGIMFCVQSGGSTILVSTVPSAALPQGIPVGVNTNMVELLHKDWGPLVQAAWYGYPSALTVITVFELILAKWPARESCDASRKRTYPAQPVQR